MRLSSSTSIRVVIFFEPRGTRFAVEKPITISPLVWPANEPTRPVVWGGLVKVVWVVAVLVWPVLKWVVTLDVLFQFVRMLYHWNTPGVFAGWTFMLHFTVLTALTYFVSMYKPKGL